MMHVLPVMLLTDLHHSAFCIALQVLEERVGSLETMHEQIFAFCVLDRLWR